MQATYLCIMHFLQFTSFALPQSKCLLLLKGKNANFLARQIGEFRHYRTEEQGCQIFLGTKYQNGGKYTKLPRTIPNVNKNKK
jgi:hypothetical protein